MRRSTRARLVTGVMVGSGIVAACGVKGPPLPPLEIIPDAVPSLRVERLDARVYVQFVVPAANTDRSRPADLERIELYGLTTDPAEAPRRPPSLDDWLEVATLVAEFSVRAPVSPEALDGETDTTEPGGSGADRGDSVAQGETVTWVETLTEDALVPVEWPAARDDRGDSSGDSGEELAEGGAPPFAVPFVAPPIPAPARRTYLVRGISSRGRESAPSERVAVSLAAVSSPPGPPMLSYTEAGVLVEWMPAPGARLPVQAAAADGVLASAPIVAFPPPSTYLVYAADSSVAARPTWPQALNAPVTPAQAPVRQGRAAPRAPATPTPPRTPVAAPLVETMWLDAPIVYGAEVCYAIRTRSVVDGLPVIGPASPPTCIVPVDTFPPQAPTGLIAVASQGAISLVWDPGPERDIAGYRVLRRSAAGETLLPLVEGPIEATSYRDATVVPGERYVYGVQALDAAVPPNVSVVSAEVTEQAR